MEDKSHLCVSNYSIEDMSVVPLGLHVIYSECRRLYPDQPNPLQVTANLKYWLGGPDPLDYISMYSNPGDPDELIPAHWHYISFGLTDLHGDGRVHHSPCGMEGTSGFGFELSMRVKREPGDINPPTWPAALMQALSRYVFQSGAQDNVLCSGDHVSWHSALDGTESRIQHMLMADDVDLQPIASPFGTVRFMQIVGVCVEELRAAQHWNGPGVIELLRSKPEAGGRLLVTDMRRGETVFELDPLLQDCVELGIERDGSNLSGVSSCCTWCESDDIVCRDAFCEEDKGSDGSSSLHTDRLDGGRHEISHFKSQRIKDMLTKSLRDPHSKYHTFENSSHDALQSHATKPEPFINRANSDRPTELIRTRMVDSVHLKFNLEAGSLLPLALRGRLKHGRHFTFKNVTNDNMAITFVPTGIVGSIADEEHPFATHGAWLHVLIEAGFLDKMISDLNGLSSVTSSMCPMTYGWPEHHLCISVLADDS